MKSFGNFKMNKLQNIFVLFNLIYLLTQLRLTVSKTNQRVICSTPECQTTAKILQTSIDTSADPCDNFYKYACGTYPKTKPSKLLQPSSFIKERSDHNLNEILEFLKKNNTDEEPRAVHKARKLFSLCMDTDDMDRKGLLPLKDILQQIGLPDVPYLNNESSNFNLYATIVKIHKILAKDFFFSISVTSNPYNQTINHIGISKPQSPELSLLPLFKNVEDNKEIKCILNYTEKIVKVMCEKFGTNTALCSNNSKIEMSTMSTLLLKEYISQLQTITMRSYSRINSSNSHLYTLQELQNFTDRIANELDWQMDSPKINWTSFLASIFHDETNVTIDFNANENIKIVVLDLEYLSEIFKFMYTQDEIVHEMGLWWLVVDSLSMYVDNSLRTMKENLIKNITAHFTREEFCTNIVNNHFGMAVGYYYAMDPTYNISKIKVQEMFGNILDIFENLIQKSSWMDSKTVEKSLKKLKYLKSFIAFPDSIRDPKDLDDYYKDVEITENFLETLLKNIKRLMVDNLRDLNILNDINKDRRIITPVMVNAFYDMERNSIYVPAGILGFPTYSAGLLAVSYGSIGSILGHEITHGFDDVGKIFNHIGNLEEWWEPRTTKEFKTRARCFVNAYNKYHTWFNGFLIKANGKLTMGENIADNAGFKEALLAYRKYVQKSGKEQYLPHFEYLTHEQLFTLGFANVWCESPTIVSFILAPMLDHSPNAVRVNQVAINSNEFSNIWNCKKGTKMNPHEKKCKMW